LSVQKNTFSIKPHSEDLFQKFAIKPHKVILRYSFYLKT